MTEALQQYLKSRHPGMLHENATTKAANTRQMIHEVRGLDPSAPRLRLLSPVSPNLSFLGVVVSVDVDIQTRTHVVPEGNCSRLLISLHISIRYLPNQAGAPTFRLTL